MKEEYLPKPTDEQAEFNNAFAFLERLNKTEYLIEDALMNWRVSDCFSYLESYENELCFCFKKDDQKNVDEIKQKIIEIFNAIPKIGKVEKKFGQTYMIGQSKIGDLRAYLIQLNKLLRQIKHKRGMGMPTKGEGKLF